jgi:hypothetical protein
LYKELVPPGVKGLEGFRRINVVDENATVSTAIECYA